MEYGTKACEQVGEDALGFFTGLVSPFIINGPHFIHFSHHQLLRLKTFKCESCIETPKEKGTI